MGWHRPPGEVGWGSAPAPLQCEKFWLALKRGREERVKLLSSSSSSFSSSSPCCCCCSSSSSSSRHASASQCEPLARTVTANNAQISLHPPSPPPHPTANTPPSLSAGLVGFFAFFGTEESPQRAAHIVKCACHLPIKKFKPPNKKIPVRPARIRAQYLQEQACVERSKSKRVLREAYRLPGVIEVLGARGFCQRLSRAAQHPSNNIFAESAWGQAWGRRKARRGYRWIGRGDVGGEGEVRVGTRRCGGV